MDKVDESALDSISRDLPSAECDRVLIADDDPMIRKILESWLRTWGYKVSAALDGAQALQLLQAEPPPQILILDWMMPELDGLELCRFVRKRNRTPYQYILLATAKNDKLDLVQGLEAGADDYLSKPFDRNELRARLRTGRLILSLQNEQIRAREAFQEQATHDSLTGIWNRKAIFDLFHREVQISLRASNTLGIMMPDVDSFKNVNDTHGHPAGDEVLREVTLRIRQAIRSGDLVGRCGGDEFLIVLPNCDKNEVTICAKRILEMIASKPVILDSSVIAITVSIGTAILESIFNTEKDALADADRALYVAKRSGRNRVASHELHSA